ncbi:MAG TPA: aldolase/citrate lyase family protein [Nitrolancea sp.]|nr:aldolase/citrate lyase family protein [Nitrolancea sp.]
MRPNELKRKLRAGQTVVGCFVGYPSAETVEICGLAGYDFVMIDAEHGPITPESAYHMVLAAEASGTTPLVRVWQNLQPVILRYMDTGAAGAMVPQVNSPEEAEAVVRAVKYHPHGRRGMAGVRAAGFGLPQPLRSYIEEANRETMVIVQVETLQTVEALPRILEVPGIDVLYVGPNDLSQSMGYPGQTDHPEVQAAIDRTIASARGHDVTLAMFVGSAEAARREIARGFQMIGLSAATILGSASRQLLDDITR